MGLIQKIKTQNFTWTHITNPNTGSIEYLRQNYNFHPLDLEDCLGPTLHAKLNDYDDYLFMVINFPVFDRSTRTIFLSELDVFIGENFIITINDKKLETITKIFENCQRNELEKEKYLSDDTTFLLYSLLNELQKYCFPILNHIAQDMQNIEDQIFNHQEQRMVREILTTKRNIVNFRNSVQSHKSAIKKLVKMSYKDFLKNDLQTYFTDTLEQAKEIWETLENQKEGIEALHNTNESLISFKLNRIMKTLTIISVILLPLNLIASITGTSYILPFQSNRISFWISLNIMFILGITTYMIFKKKRWLD